MIVLADARALDAADPFASLRQRFALPSNRIYLDGNSLGALPTATMARVGHTVANEWGQGLIGSWNDAGWIDAPRRLGAAIAPLIGARPDEVIVTDSTSVNLFKLLAAALAARPGRHTILSEPGNFPTDLYVAEGVARMSGARLRTAPADSIIEAIDADTAVLMLTHVHYRTGRKLDMRAITTAAHEAGALVLWDLSHSAGAVALDLDSCDVDLAVGCGYKYLNGGPGAPAFLFVADRLHGALQSPLSGWMGHAAPFEFTDAYQPADDLRRFLCGTPSIIAMAALEEGLRCFDDVDLAALFAKGQALAEFAIELVAQRCPEITLLSPRAADQRGSHVAFAHPQAYAVTQALIARGVVGDFRAPDALRIGFTPLYTGFEDVWRFADALTQVLHLREWDHPDHQRRAAVT